METRYRRCNKNVGFLRIEYHTDKNFDVYEVITLVVTPRSNCTHPFIRRERDKYVDFIAFEIDSDALEWQTAFNETVNYLLNTKIN